MVVIWIVLLAFLAHHIVFAMDLTGPDLTPDTPTDAEQWAQTQLENDAKSVVVFENGTARATWPNNTTTEYQNVTINATAEVVG